MALPAILDQYGRPLAPIERAAVQPVTYDPGPGNGGWYPLVREPFTGAWQRNMEQRADSVLSNVAVFTCVSLIATDIAKCNYRLIEEVEPGVWDDVDSAAFSPVLREPNHFQTSVQFMERWMLSRLTAGNSYIFLRRDNRGIVIEMYVLNPARVKPLVADNGDIFYQLSSDNLAGLDDQVIVPASEVIHDRWNPFYHDLVGISPMYAAGPPATQGNRIVEHSTQFFANSANPGGFLTAPGRISNDTADRIRAGWQEKFSGGNAGLVAVLGDGLKYDPIGITALNSQLVEQLRWSAEMVCAGFKVPGYKAGIAQPPTNANVEALDQQYYSGCLQTHFENIEASLSRGLRLPKSYWVEFDLDGLLRMDTETKMRALREGVQGGFVKPNEARKRFGYGPVDGGDACYLQQQNYSLPALAKRDAQDDPFASATQPAAPPPQQPANDTGGANVADQSAALADLFYRYADACA